MGRRGVPSAADAPGSSRTGVGLVSAAIFGLTTARDARLGLARASGRFGLKTVKWEWPMLIFSHHWPKFPRLTTDDDHRASAHQRAGVGEQTYELAAGGVVALSLWRYGGRTNCMRW